MYADLLALTSEAHFEAFNWWFQVEVCFWGCHAYKSGSLHGCVPLAKNQMGDLQYLIILNIIRHLPRYCVVNWSF